MWTNGSWSLIPTENPCSNNGQDLAFLQPCTLRVANEIIIVTFTNRNTCTSILNLQTYNWILLNTTYVNIPIGGHLVTSVDKSRVFYLGGLDHKKDALETQSLDIYELNYNGWNLIEAKLPFGISSNATGSYSSMHNVTLD